MTTATARNRARLLNLIDGGNGQTEPYIERVTLDGAAPEQRTAYCYHSPAGKYDNGKHKEGQEYIGTLDKCKMFLLLPYLEQPEAWAQHERAITIEDYGRHIAAEVWRAQWEVLRFI